MCITLFHVLLCNIKLLDTIFQVKNSIVLLNETIVAFCLRVSGQCLGRLQIEAKKNKILTINVNASSLAGTWPGFKVAHLF